MKTLNLLKIKSLALITMLSITTLASSQSVSVCKVAQVYQNVNEIEVDAAFASVNIVGSERADVDFKGEIFCSKESKDVSIKHSQDGNKLKIFVDQSLFTTGRYKGEITLLVPKHTHLNISSGSGEIITRTIFDTNAEFSSGSGSINISDFAGGGNAHTGSGSIEILNSTGKFESNSGSGSVKVQNYKGELHLNAASGSIDGVTIQGQIEASSASGSVTFKDVSNLTSQAKFSAVSGEVNLNNVKGDVSASAVSGSVNISNFEGVIKAESVSGSINGQAITLTASSEFESVSGSIDVSLVNPAESLSFDLSAMSGSLEAKGIRASKELVIKKGEILIKGETVSGSQEYK